MLHFIFYLNKRTLNTIYEFLGKSSQYKNLGIGFRILVLYFFLNFTSHLEFKNLW